jgi:hypothetical protein
MRGTEKVEKTPQAARNVAGAKARLICGYLRHDDPARPGPEGAPAPRHPGTPVVPFQNIDDHLRGGHPGTLAV